MTEPTHEEIDKTIPGGPMVNCSKCGIRRFPGYGPCDCGHYEQRRAIFIAKDITAALSEALNLSRKLEDAIEREKNNG